MTAAPVHITGPVADTRTAHRATQEALRDAVERSAELLRGFGDGAVPVPGLSWSAAETAAHLVGELGDYTQALTRHANGYLTHANRTQESPSHMGAVVNARQLADIPERDMSVLANLLEEAGQAYQLAAGVADETATIPVANGLLLTPPTMTSLLLGEQVVHGLDIARAKRMRWDISDRDAALVAPGALSVAPQYLRPSALTLRASFELRIRGVNHYRMAVDHGTAVVGSAGERADCVITADPVAFLLVGFGRTGQWSPILRGKMRAGGRKPWLAMKFATLLATP
jgi:hypothetical protein